MDHIRKLLIDDEGATAIEYALIASLMIIVSLVAFGAFGAAVTGKFTYIETNVTSATSSS